MHEASSLAGCDTARNDAHAEANNITGRITRNTTMNPIALASRSLE